MTGRRQSHIHIKDGSRKTKELQAITEQILRSNSIFEIWILKRRGRRILGSMQERRA